MFILKYQHSIPGSGCTDLYCASGALEILLCKGWGVTESQLDLPFDFIVRSWLWSTATRSSPLPTSVVWVQAVDNYSTNCGSRFSTDGLMAIEDFTFKKVALEIAWLPGSFRRLEMHNKSIPGIHNIQPNKMFVPIYISPEKCTPRSMFEFGSFGHFRTCCLLTFAV